MQADPSAQVIALVIQSIGAVILGGLFWLVRKAAVSVKEIHARLDHLDECVDAQRQDSVAEREVAEQTRTDVLVREGLYRSDSIARDERIAQLRVDYAGLEGWIKGTNRLPIDKSINEIDPAN